MSDDLLEIGDRIVGWAKEGEQVEAVAIRSKETDIRAYAGEVEQLSSAEALGVGVRVIAGNRQGFAYAGTFDNEVLQETLAEARDNATFGTPDEFLALAEPDGVEPVELDVFRAALADVPTDRKVDLAIELERAVRAGDPRISGIESAEYGDALSEAAIVSTTGIRTSSRETGASLVAYALASEGSETQTGFGFSVGRHPDELDFDKVVRDAVDRSTRMLGATKPTSERVTLVLDPWVTSQLLGIIGSTLNGESVLKGRSLFAHRVGEDVASPLITFVDDPTNPLAFTATAIDGEGLASRRTPLIDAGVLLGFVHNSYTARRSGTTSTGSATRGSHKSTPGVGCRAVTLAPGTATQAELIAQVGEGVLIQDVSGLHSGVNPVSGDFSTGAEGLRISGGALGEPIREFTIASTLQRMLKDVAAVGGDVEWLPMSAAGVSLVVHDVTVSGQ
jgi:PmbA protein